LFLLVSAVWWGAGGHVSAFYFVGAVGRGLMCAFLWLLFFGIGIEGEGGGKSLRILCGGGTGGGEVLWICLFVCPLRAWSFAHIFCFNKMPRLSVTGFSCLFITSGFQDQSWVNMLNETSLLII